MLFDPDVTNPSGKNIPNDISRFDPRRDSARKEIVFTVGIILTFFVSAWLFGGPRHALAML